MAYIALRPLKISDEITRQPGEVVPEAEGWTNVRNYLGVGYLKEVPDPAPCPTCGAQNSSSPPDPEAGERRRSPRGKGDAVSVG